MRTLQAAKDAADDGIAVHVVATVADYDERLTSIASDKALFYTSPNFDVRDRLIDSINGMACELDECRLCDFTHGQIWLPDTANCHMFYLCEKVKVGEYRKQHMTCGDLWWKQDIHTCVRSPPEGCDVNVSVNIYVTPSTTEAPCPYERVSDRDGYFRLIGSPNEIFRCGDGMAFLRLPCGCVPKSEINPTCADDLLLHFPYEDHYNDVTCHGAVATQYGEGVKKKFDASRRGIVACFSGKTHFERHGDQPGISTIVSNNNCKQQAGFSVSTSTSTITGSITSDGRHVVVDAPQAADVDWHHAAWVYDGRSLKLYIDGVLRNQQLAYAEGYMQNNDVPMHIGNDCAGNYFVGCLDELRVYERVLSVDDIKRLMKLPLA
ncbi:hypothetical protein NP493_743g03045 [Ridgeia piscesae]|uniref:LamG-like jellyroll fold domain-containing protein n=1 Tax=Ridgeia piscesae TaxID=27915 RepID=A0AAD9NM14_RIDPI|nr:hypothetical protein NP493_743g03045 [Ridgeia piscesae]